MIFFRFMVVFILSGPVFFTTVFADKSYIGRWCWDDDNDMNAFGIIIKKSIDLYEGGYFSVSQGGAKIDDNESAFSFKNKDQNIIQTKIKAGITGNIGLLQLKMINNKKLEWLILSLPDGEFFVPHKAILHKC